MKIIGAVWDPNRHQVTITWQRPALSATPCIAGTFWVLSFREAEILCAQFDSSFDIKNIETHPMYRDTFLVK